MNCTDIVSSLVQDPYVLSDQMLVTLYDIMGNYNKGSYNGSKPVELPWVPHSPAGLVAFATANRQLAAAIGGLATAPALKWVWDYLRTRGRVVTVIPKPKLSVDGPLRYDKNGAYIEVTYCGKVLEVRVETPDVGVLKDTSITQPEMAVQGSTFTKSEWPNGIVEIHCGEEHIGMGSRIEYQNGTVLATVFHVWESMNANLEADGAPVTIQHGGKAIQLHSTDLEVVLSSPEWSNDMALIRVKNEALWTRLGVTKFNTATAIINAPVCLYGYNKDSEKVMSVGTLTRGSRPWSCFHSASSLPTWSGTPLISRGQVVGFHIGSYPARKTNHGSLIFWLSAITIQERQGKRNKKRIVGDTRTTPKGGKEAMYDDFEDRKKAEQDSALNEWLSARKEEFDARGHDWAREGPASKVFVYTEGQTNHIMVGTSGGTYRFDDIRDIEGPDAWANPDESWQPEDDQRFLNWWTNRESGQTMKTPPTTPEPTDVGTIGTEKECKQIIVNQPKPVEYCGNKSLFEDHSQTVEIVNKCNKTTTCLFNCVNDTLEALCHEHEIITAIDPGNHEEHGEMLDFIADMVQEKVYDWRKAIHTDFKPIYTTREGKQHSLKWFEVTGTADEVWETHQMAASWYKAKKSLSDKLQCPFNDWCVGTMKLGESCVPREDPHSILWYSSTVDGWRPVAGVIYPEPHETHGQVPDPANREECKRNLCSGLAIIGTPCIKKMSKVPKIPEKTQEELRHYKEKLELALEKTRHLEQVNELIHKEKQALLETISDSSIDSDYETLHKPNEVTFKETGFQKKGQNEGPKKMLVRRPQAKPVQPGEIVQGPEPTPGFKAKSLPHNKAALDLAYRDNNPGRTIQDARNELKTIKESRQPLPSSTGSVASKNGKKKQSTQSAEAMEQRISRMEDALNTIAQSVAKLIVTGTTESNSGVKTVQESGRIIRPGSPTLLTPRPEEDLRKPVTVLTLPSLLGLPSITINVSPIQLRKWFQFTRTRNFRQKFYRMNIENLGTCPCQLTITVLKRQIAQLDHLSRWMVLNLQRHQCHSAALQASLGEISVQTTWQYLATILTSYSPRLAKDSPCLRNLASVLGLSVPTDLELWISMETYWPSEIARFGYGKMDIATHGSHSSRTNYTLLSNLSSIATALSKIRAFWISSLIAPCLHRKISWKSHNGPDVRPCLEWAWTMMDSTCSTGFTCENVLVLRKVWPMLISRLGIGATQSSISELPLKHAEGFMDYALLPEWPISCADAHFALCTVCSCNQMEDCSNNYAHICKSQAESTLQPTIADSENFGPSISAQ